MVLPWYSTLESVKLALDVKLTARSDATILRALQQASRNVEKLTHRRFYPWTGTRYLDWPTRDQGTWRLWLDGDTELGSVTSLVAGGAAIAAADYFLYPAGAADVGEPYTQIQIDLSSSAALVVGDTHQRNIAVTSTSFHYPGTAEPAGTLAEGLDASETGVDVSDSAAVGIGDLIVVDSERMIVTGRAQLTTGQTLQTPLTASAGNDAVVVTNGAAFTAGEVVTLDTERMRVVDIVGNTLTVKRAWDGTTLAAHTGSTVYAPRTLTVERGALGTTAATHTTSTAIIRHVPPGPVQELTEAETINTVLNKTAGYSRVVGGGENEREASGRALRELRKQVYDGYARKIRHAAV